MSLKPGSRNNTNQALNNYSRHTAASFCMFCMISPAINKAGDQAAKGQICKHGQAQNSQGCCRGVRHGSAGWGATAAPSARPAQSNAAAWWQKSHIFQGTWGQKERFPMQKWGWQYPAHQSTQQPFSIEWTPSAMTHWCYNALGFPLAVLVRANLRCQAFFFCNRQSSSTGKPPALNMHIGKIVENTNKHQQLPSKYFCREQIHHLGSCSHCLTSMNN